MPCDYTLYPKDWQAIRARILARAKNLCEWCGVPNRRNVQTLPDGERVVLHGAMVRCPGVDQGVVEIVLTIAHINQDVTDNRDENLAALCQRCHNRHDAKLRAVHASATRDMKRGQLRFQEDAYAKP